MPTTLHETFNYVLSKDKHQALVFQFGENDYVATSRKKAAEELGRLTKFLQDQNFPQGTKIGLLAENRYEWLVAYFAAVSLGLIVVPLDPNGTLLDWERILLHAQIPLVFTDGVRVTKIERLLSNHPNLKQIVSFDSLPDTLPEIQQYPKILKDQKNSKSKLSLPRALPGDIASIFYTSGTTGNPQGVMLSHEGILLNAGIINMGHGKPGDILASILPLHHVFGLSVAFSSVFHEVSLVFYSSLKPEAIRSSLRRLRPHMLLGVPVFYERLVHGIRTKMQQEIPAWFYRLLVELAPGPWGDSSETARWVKEKIFKKIHDNLGGRLYLVGSGGAALDPDTHRFLNLLGIKVCHGYGLTETNAVVACNRDSGMRVGSVGRPFKAFQVRIDDPDDKGIGEICIRGGSVMEGYYRNPEANEQVFDETGWFHSGDLGYLDADGFLFITDRKKDMILGANGENVYPFELEHHFGQIPELAETCVFGIPAAKGKKTERIHLQVVPNLEGKKKNNRSDCKKKIKALIDQKAQELPAFKRPGSIGFSWDPFPKTTTLKIKKYEVKKLFLEKTQKRDLVLKLEKKQAAKAKDGVENFVFASIEKLIPECPPLNLETSLGHDLGIDSLTALELWAKVEEKVGLKIPREVAFAWQKVGDIVAYLESTPDKSASNTALPSTYSSSASSQFH